MEQRSPTVEIELNGHAPTMPLARHSNKRLEVIGLK
jgi:hypothetical protein